MRMSLLDVSIRTRLALAIALLLALLIVVAAQSFSGFQALSQSAHDLVDRKARHVFLADCANQHAQTAAKRRHSGVALASQVIEEHAPEQLSLIGEMREALAGNQFVAFYQPKMDLHTRRITGAEALIRWRHPLHGLVPPGKFIPFAEQTGFIREITP
jgi:predicted signal transduction protein with EAL and GGDEF domain